MKVLLLFILLIPSVTHANFIMQYGLNYSSETDDTKDDDYEKTRTFHKIFLGASVNSKKTFFFGWNVNSWSSSLTRDSDEETYSVLEMGPRLHYFFGENYNMYVTAEWNPYAKGERKKGTEDAEISGSSIDLGIGYRFRISRLWGLGASLHYHTLSMKEEIIDDNKDDISDSVKNIMPMLELTLITK